MTSSTSLRLLVAPVVPLLGALTTGLLLTPTAHASTYSAYAGPNVFGPWIQIGAHAGAVAYSIKATPVGSTTIVGEVAYFGVDGQRKVEPFYGSTVIRTCHCVGTIQVHFKGIPTGSAVTVTINP